MVSGFLILLTAISFNGLGFSGPKTIPPAFRHGHRGARVVALSFDDGPHRRITPDIIRTLEDKDCRATFFLLGREVRKNPETVRALAESPRCEIGNHSINHPDFGRLGKEQALQEIMENQWLIERVSGVIPRLFRPPYGSVGRGLFAASRQAGVSIVLWDVDPEDWRGGKLSASEIAERVRPGSIILLHDIYPGTAEMLPELIDELRERGFEFWFVSELINFRRFAEAADALLSNLGFAGAGGY